MARHLGIPLAFKGAIEVINAGHVLKMDTGTIGSLESDKKSDVVFISPTLCSFLSEAGRERVVGTLGAGL